MLNFFIVLGLGIMAFVMYKMYRSATQGYENEKEGNKKQSQTNLTPEGKVDRSKSSQDFLLFEDIEDNMVKLDSRRYRAYIRVEPPDWPLKSFAEQDILQTQFLKIVNGLRYSIDIYIQRIRTDVDKNMKIIEQNAEGYGIQELSDFGQELIAETRRWVQVQSPLSHGFYLIVYFDEIQNVKGYSAKVIKKQALLELDTRCSTLIDALGRAGIEAYKITDPEIAQLINFNMNRDSGARYTIQEAIQKGVFSISVTSHMERKKEPALARTIYNTELPFDEGVS